MKFEEINESMVDDILRDLDKQRIRLIDIGVPVTAEQRIETSKRIDEWDVASEKWADGSMLCYEDNIDETKFVSGSNPIRYYEVDVDENKFVLTSPNKSIFDEFDEEDGRSNG